MKKIKLLVYSPLLLLLLLLPFLFPGSAAEQQAAQEATGAIVPPDTADAIHATALHTGTAASEPKPAAVTKPRPKRPSLKDTSSREIISYALSLLGTPYTYGGTSSNGFDCSGFTNHVFNTFGINVSRSSSTQALDGTPVSKEEARPGDLVIFTGTNPSERTPGHVGIVISRPGDTISFVHSSSNGGVKVSKVQGTRYNTRFLQIRRVL